MMGYWGYGMDYGVGYSLLHFVSAFFWIVVAVLIISLLLRRGRDWKHGHHHNHFFEDNAMSTLRDRYAKGEINREEFEAKKKDLMN